MFVVCLINFMIYFRCLVQTPSSREKLSIDLSPFMKNEEEEEESDSDTDEEEETNKKQRI